MIEVIDDDMAAVLRKKTGAERLKIVDALYRTAWKLVEGNVRAEHPDWDENRVRRAVAQRIAGATYLPFDRLAPRQVPTTSEDDPGLGAHRTA